MSRKPTPVPAKIENSPADLKSADVQIAMRAQVERVIGPLVGGQQKELIVERLTSLVVSEKFSGPIAHPRHLEAYEQICPGAAERIIAMAEREQESKHDLIKADIGLATSAQRDDADDKKRGMRLGFAAFIIMMVCALIALHWKEPWMAAGFLATSVASAVGIFVQGRARKNGDVEE